MALLKVKLKEKMMQNKQELNFDFVVAGAGIPGICAAIQAARLGLKVALLEASAYLGGNASPEVRVNINGADGTDEFNFAARAGGIVDEIVLENLHRNLQGNAFHFEALLQDYVDREKNISLFLNTAVCAATYIDKDGSTIIQDIFCFSWKNEKTLSFSAPFFMDCTGTGALGALVQAEFMQGRESQDVFSESLAPKNSDDSILLGTLIYRAKDTGKPVKFSAPDFAMDIEKSGVLSYREIPKDSFFTSRWFYEVGSGISPTDENKLLQSHKALVYGIWDYVKNSGKYPSQNYDLEYVSCTVGKREGRRFVGDIVLTQNDIVERRQFKDCVAFGGWSIDLHAVHGFFDTDFPNKHYYLPGIYQIPYRTCYSKNVENLFVGGRCASFSHVAHGSTRVMATLGALAQAVGAAAAICVQKQQTPRQVFQKHLISLQQILLQYDAFLPGIRRTPSLEGLAQITATSEMESENQQAESFSPLKHDRALIFSVNKENIVLHTWVRPKQNTELEVEFYKSETPSGYDPSCFIEKRKIYLLKSADAQKLDLSTNIKSYSGFIWAVFKANSQIEIAVKSGNETETFSLEYIPNTQPNTCDVNTGETKKHVWERSNENICYQLPNAKNQYAAQNIANGYSRTFSQPNCWRSKPTDAPQQIELFWETPVALQNITIRFCADYSRRIYTHLDLNDGITVVPQITSDYSIHVIDNENQKVKIADIHSNFSRQNIYQFNSILVQKLVVKLHKTNGALSFGIDEIICT